jgi:hypothetical protein
LYNSSEPSRKINLGIIMTKLDKAEVIAKFTEAYQKVNGKAPQIEEKSGWFSVDGGKNVRLAALEEMTAELAGGQSAESKPAKAAKAPAKTKAVAKAAPAPKGLGYKVVKRGEGFTPAYFWLEYLASLGTDCRTPHGFY